MRIFRVKYKNNIFYANINGSTCQIFDLEKDIEQNVYKDQITVLTNIVAPSKVVCIGLNYQAHAKEMGLNLPEEPLIFLKPSSAIIGNKEAIVCPQQSDSIHYEGELALVIGKKCRKVTQDQTKDYLLGFTCANDVTARDLQQKDGLYARAKGFDSFCPVGPWIETEINNPDQLRIKTMVNGQTKQDSSTSDMIFEPFFLISFISNIMTLYPGDIILTGTPPGIGPVSPGDKVQIEIEGIGCLENNVI